MANKTISVQNPSGSKQPKGERPLPKKLEHWRELYHDAIAKRGIVQPDERILRRRALYKGSNLVRDRRTGGMSARPAYNYRNLCFELIETQINNTIYYPKVTARDALNKGLSNQIEGYLKAELDRLNFETINDEAERECLIQGNVWYFVGWDNMKSTPTTQGELICKTYPLERVAIQPGVLYEGDAEYAFTEDLVSVRKIKEEFGVVIPEAGQYRGMNKLITAYYFNDDGYLSRYGWVDDVEVFDDEAYELRRFRTCKQCDTKVPQELVCPVCASTKFYYKPEEYETMQQQLVRGQVSSNRPEVLVEPNDVVPYYKVRQLPLVLRRNIADVTQLYGLSDIDLLENSQEALNKIHTKMEENILKGGLILTLPTGVQIKLDDETIKVIRVKDPNMARNIQAFSVQPNIQQDDVFSDRIYQFARGSLGITDSYQGKRDPTAESGKAKEISAAQASGRLESKRRMKAAAYSRIYELMFRTLLAYCDEPRTFSYMDEKGDVVEGKFNRYNYLDGVRGAVYYNDRFLFAVDNAASLAANREAMWRETVNAFQMGTFGNPADPRTLILFWTVMDGLGYPLAQQALNSVRQRMQQLPPELEQAIMQDPQILQDVQRAARGELVPANESNGRGTAAGG